MLITVATTVSRRSSPSRIMRVAHMRHDRVAVDDLPLLVDHDHAVGVAVERDADLGPAPHDLGPHVVGVQRAAARG